MRTFAIVAGVLCLLLAGCTGGSAGKPSDDIGDIFVLTHSPGNGDQLDVGDSDDGFNPLNTPTLRNPGAVTMIFTNSLNPGSVLNPDPSDPQGTRNVRLFFFDTNQGPFDPAQPTMPGVNPPGANVLIPATTVLTTTNVANDTLILRPTGVTATAPMREGQYSVIVELGVQGADGGGMRGQEYFFFFRVGEDTLGPVITESSPASGEKDVDPTREIRVTLSETIQASTVSNSTITVSYQPAGTTAPTAIPGTWFTDGGAGPGNNFPNLQLDRDGIPGRTGSSPRNGIDLVFRPLLDTVPVNITSQDPNDPFCTLITDPPNKGNSGFPLGQAITVQFVTQGVGVSDTAGNQIPAGSPNTMFTFETLRMPDAVFAPNTNDAVYFGDTIGVGVIQVDPTRTPYLVGPNPRRSQNEVVTSGTGPARAIVRVPIPDLVDLNLDDRPWSAFHVFICNPFGGIPTIYMSSLYALSGSRGGGEVTVLDTFNMRSMGRFGTPSPGGIALTTLGNTGRAAVSNFSANTVTVFDIGSVTWYTGGTYTNRQANVLGQVATGASTLLLEEVDFQQAFPHQRNDQTSPPGPPIIGTFSVGVSPSRVTVTGLSNSIGIFNGVTCFSPILTNDPIMAVLNAGENTADFSHLTNLAQDRATSPDLDGINLSSQPVDVAWATWSGRTRAYYFYITSIGGTVELFSSGQIAFQPSVLPNASSNLAPNKIINNIGGFDQPTDVLWLTNGNGVFLEPGATNYTGAALVAETGRNRIQQIAITAEVPSNLFQVINENHASGLGPVSLAGDPVGARAVIPCTPQFTTYYVANAGEGTVRTASYQGGVLGAEVPVPGVLRLCSWWSR